MGQGVILVGDAKSFHVYLLNVGDAVAVGLMVVVVVGEVVGDAEEGLIVLGDPVGFVVVGEIVVVGD